MTVPEPSQGAPSPSPPSKREFSPKAQRKIEWLLTRYRVKAAALLPLLRIAEEEFGAIDGAAVTSVARELDLSPAHVHGVVTFCPHFRKEGDGKYVIKICCTLSCALRGTLELLKHLEDRLGILPGETTLDGTYTLKTVQCLGSCGTAPAIQINDDDHENLTVETLDKILDSLK